MGNSVVAVRRLRGALGDCGGCDTGVVKHLGVDFTGGKTWICVGCTTRAVRWKKGASRRDRSAILRRAVGKRAFKVFFGGIVPQATFGAPVVVLDDREPQRLQRYAGALMAPR